MKIQKKIYKIGFDFGTSNSIASYINTQDKSSQLIVDETGSEQYPSLLLFEKDKMNNLTTFGSVVKKNPSVKSIIQEIKRFIGKSYSDELAQMASDLGMIMEKGEKGECIFIIIDEQTGEELKFTVEELVAIELRHIKKIVTNRCKEADFSQVVLTVPSSFDEKQKQSMKYAFELAGINYVTVLNEPTAALNEYRYFDKQRVIKKAIVIDIGGGTTDVCVCEVVGEILNIKGNGGDSLLGGSDFDKIIMDIIVEKLEENEYEKMYLFKPGKNENKKQRNERMKFTNKLKKEAESVKIALSTRENYLVNMDDVLPRGDEIDEIQISREEFEEKIQENYLIERIEDCIDASLGKAKINVDEIDTVILVGGLPKMPIVRNMIVRKFGEKSIISNPNYDPLNAVAKGAARYAYDYSIKSSNVKKITEYIPYSIGIEVSGGKMEFIAKKGDKTPITNWNKTFRTTYSNQETIEFNVYKGEEPYTMDNEYIGTCQVTHLPRRPAGEVQVICHIDIENTGNLEMKATQIGGNGQSGNLTTNCGFDQESKKYEESKDKIEPYCPDE